MKELGNGGEEAGFQDPMQGASFLFPLKQPDCCVSHHHKPCPRDPESGEQEVQPSVETWVGGIGGRSEEGPGGWGQGFFLVMHYSGSLQNCMPGT